MLLIEVCVVIITIAIGLSMLTIFSIAKYLQELIAISEKSSNKINEWFTELVDVLYKTPKEKEIFSDEYEKIQNIIDKKPQKKVE